MWAIKGCSGVDEGTEIWKDDNLIKSYFPSFAVDAGWEVFQLWPLLFFITINEQNPFLLFGKTS